MARAVPVHDVPHTNRQPHTLDTGVESYVYKEQGMVNGLQNKQHVPPVHTKAGKD